MGARRFLLELQKQEALQPLFAGGDLSPKKAAEIVAHFRASFPLIKSTWRRLESEFREALGGKQSGEIYRQDGKDIVAVLPSRRLLRYERPRLHGSSRKVPFLNARGEEETLTFNGEQIVCGADGDTEYLYGGKLLENLVQAIARDVLVLTVLDLEARGFKVVLHVHDEVVLEVLEADAERARDAARELLSRDPGWWPHLGPLPLASDKGRIADRYGEAT
jgi:DNA polymerase